MLARVRILFALAVILSGFVLAAYSALAIRSYYSAAAARYDALTAHIR